MVFPLSTLFFTNDYIIILFSVKQSAVFADVPRQKQKIFVRVVIATDLSRAA
jgi:hypothetical protein